MSSVTPHPPQLVTSAYLIPMTSSLSEVSVKCSTAPPSDSLQLSLSKVAVGVCVTAAPGSKSGTLMLNLTL
jgi:hypothetical protein